MENPAKNDKKYLLGEDTTKRSQSCIIDAFAQKKTVDKTNKQKNDTSDASEVSTTSDDKTKRSTSTSPEKEKPSNEGKKDNTVVIDSPEKETPSNKGKKDDMVVIDASDSEYSSDSSGSSVMMSDRPAVERDSSQEKPASARPENKTSNRDSGGALEGTSNKKAKETAKDVTNKKSNTEFHIKKNNFLKNLEFGELKKLAAGLGDRYYQQNAPETIGGNICHFSHDTTKFNRMKNLLSSILDIDWKKDIATDDADYPFLRKNIGSCALHSDSVTKKRKV